jgi:hypothetical protein
MNRAFAAKGPWLIQIVSIVALTIWAASDAAFEVMIQRLRIATGTPFDVLQETMRYVGYWRPLLLLCVVGVSLGGLGCWLAKLFIRQRSSPDATGNDRNHRLLVRLSHQLFDHWDAGKTNTAGSSRSRFRIASRTTARRLA